MATTVVTAVTVGGARFVITEDSEIGLVAVRSVDTGMDEWPQGEVRVFNEGVRQTPDGHLLFGDFDDDTCPLFFTSTPCEAWFHGDQGGV